MKTATDTGLHVSYFSKDRYIADPSRECSYWREPDGSIDEDRANLFAAAPKLLEQLKHLVRWHGQLTAVDLDKAGAVIARAEGR